MSGLGRRMNIKKMISNEYDPEHWEIVRPCTEEELKWRNSRMINIPWPEEPYSTFHGFRKLPAEIRDRIWYYALPGPRILSLVESEEEETCWFGEMNQSCYILIERLRHEFLLREDNFWSMNPDDADPLSRVNRESRQVFLKHYTHICPGKPNGLHPVSPDDQIIFVFKGYIDPKIDTVLIPASDWSVLACLGELHEGITNFNNLENLALQSNNNHYHDYTEDAPQLRLMLSSQFKCLKQLTIVMDGPREGFANTPVNTLVPLDHEFINDFDFIRSRNGKFDGYHKYLERMVEHAAYLKSFYRPECNEEHEYWANIQVNIAIAAFTFSDFWGYIVEPKKDDYRRIKRLFYTEVPSPTQIRYNILVEQIGTYYIEPCTQIGSEVVLENRYEGIKELFDDGEE